MECYNFLLPHVHCFNEGKQPLTESCWLCQLALPLTFCRLSVNVTVVPSAGGEGRGGARGASFGDGLCVEVLTPFLSGPGSPWRRHRAHWVGIGHGPVCLAVLGSVWDRDVFLTRLSFSAQRSRWLSPSLCLPWRPPGDIYPLPLCPWCPGVTCSSSSPVRRSPLWTETAFWSLGLPGVRYPALPEGA